MVLSVFLIIKLDKIIANVTETNAKLTNGIHKDIENIKLEIQKINIELIKTKTERKYYENKHGSGSDQENFERDKR